MTREPFVRAAKRTLSGITAALLAGGFLAGDAVAAGETVAQPERATNSVRVQDDPDRPIEELVIVSEKRSKARERLRTVPGGASFIDAESFRDGSVSSAKDVLDFAPGVFAQSRFGNAETRISIRGSGISQTFGLRGVRFLRDGLPLNDADGFFNSELVEPLNAQYVEVYRGANALEFGSSTLGGAVNFVSHTGHTAPALTARLSGGSNDQVRPQVSTGLVLGGGWDLFVSFSGLYQDGFRGQSEEDASRAFLNLGYRWNESSETRLRVQYQDNKLELPGGLTKANLQANPEQANDVFAFGASARNQEIWRVELHHTQRFGTDNRLDVNAFFETADFFHPLPFFVQEDDPRDMGGSLRHQFTHSLFGPESDFVWGARLAYGDDENDRYAPAGGGETGPLIRVAEDRALMVEGFFENRVSLSEALTLSIGTQIAFAERESETSFGDGLTAEEDYVGVSPKLGVTYAVSEATQLFANVSRSFEPPTNGEFADASVGVLDDQTATTIEIGSRGALGPVEWDIAAFHAWLDDEILTIELAPLPSGEFATANAGDTLHSGIETGLRGEFPLGWLGDDRLEAQLTYTYNRFVFDGDPAFDNNDIPGLPQHFGKAELAYAFGERFRLAMDVQAADSYYVDFRNSLGTDAYAILGARVNVGLADGVKLFLEGRNLTDKTYTATTSLLPDAGGADASVFNPGLTRSVFAGVEARF